MSSWPSLAVSALQTSGVLFVEDGNHGGDRPRPDEFTSEGVAFIRAADMRGGRIDFRGASKINEVAFNRIRKGFGRPLDVLLSHKGTVGRVAMAPADSPEFVCSPQTTYWRSLDPIQIDPFYLRYFLESPAFKRQLDARSGETDMAAYVSLTEQRKLTVVVPPIEAQHGIAATLGALDDKIESNRHASVLCLRLAEASFMQAVAMAHETQLGTVANLVLGGTPDRKRQEYWTDGVVPWINSGSANQDVIISPTELITEAAFASSAAKLMPTGATVVAITGATLGQVALLGIDTSGNQSLVGVWADDLDLTAWLHFAIRSAIPDLIGAATGAAQQHVNKGNIEALKVPIINDKELRKWSVTSRPLLNRAVDLRREIATLELLRNLLLPELLSGRMRVPEAEKVVEGAIA